MSRLSEYSSTISSKFSLNFFSFTFGMGTFVTGAIGPTYQQLLTYYTASAQWASGPKCQLFGLTVLKP